MENLLAVSQNFASIFISVQTSLTSFFVTSIHFSSNNSDAASTTTSLFCVCDRWRRRRRRRRLFQQHLFGQDCWEKGEILVILGVVKSKIRVLSSGSTILNFFNKNFFVAVCNYASYLCPASLVRIAPSEFESSILEKWWFLKWHFATFECRKVSTTLLPLEQWINVRFGWLLFC